MIERLKRLIGWRREPASRQSVRAGFANALEMLLAGGTSERIGELEREIHGLEWKILESKIESLQQAHDRLEDLKKHYPDLDSYLSGAQSNLERGGFDLALRASGVDPRMIPYPSRVWN